MKLVFILKGDPFSWKAHEAFRVGMALAINSEVYFVLIKDGVYALTRWDAENLGIHGFEKLLQNLGYVNMKIVVEDASAEERGLKKEDMVLEPIFMSMEEIGNLVKESEGVFVW